MSPRHSAITAKEIAYDFHLVFSEDGAMRFSRGAPGLNPGERSMGVRAKLPRTLFRTPQLSATIAVAEGQPAAFNIDIKAAGEALSGAIGCDVQLKVIE